MVFLHNLRRHIPTRFQVIGSRAFLEQRVTSKKDRIEGDGTLHICFSVDTPWT